MNALYVAPLIFLLTVLLSTSPLILLRQDLHGLPAGEADPPGHPPVRPPIPLPLPRDHLRPGRPRRLADGAGDQG